MSPAEESLAKVADELFSLIRPYYKKRNPGSPPEFKRTMKPEETQHLFKQLHDIVVDIKMGARKVNAA